MFKRVNVMNTISYITFDIFELYLKWLLFTNQFKF